MTDSCKFQLANAKQKVVWNPGCLDILPNCKVCIAILPCWHYQFVKWTLPNCQVHIAKSARSLVLSLKEPSSQERREREGKEGGEGVSLGSLWKKKKWGAVWVLGKPEEFWHWTAQNFLNLWAGWTSFRQSTGWSGPGNWPCWCAVANLGMQALECGLDNWAYGLCNLANWTWQTGKVNLAK